MPMRRMRHRVGRRRQRGRGILSFLGKAKDFLQRTKLVSNIGSALGQAGVPYAQDISNVAGSLGFGRRRKGRGLRLAGGMRRCR